MRHAWMGAIAFLIQIVLPSSKAAVLTVLVWFHSFVERLSMAALVTTVIHWRHLWLDYGFVTEAGPSTHLLMAGTC